ncbi:RNA polymerase sigma factor [Lysobacter sp. A3-1-A15]|uniref:RNA polymerase sigma factor n=1 Tax=Novilysobacter viscosus TaxID=3098602 RepID=UPI002ED85DB7
MDATCPPARAAQDAHRTVEAVWRIESPRLIARLARMLRDVGHAEDLAQDALVAALEHWPREGVPDNPGAWLMQTAKRRGIDRIRHRELVHERHAQFGQALEPAPMPAPDDTDRLDDDIGDDLLRLVFTTCHPVLSTEAQVALTLRMLGGLTTAEIARAFLQPEPTVAQRIVRAKKTLASRQVGFQAPRREDLAERLAAVLGVVYLVFNEGYAATAGEDWMRPALCQDAMRLGRVLAGLLPGEPEVHGLVALMEIQASRIPARTQPDGTPILLLEQDRGRWDRLLIGHGLAALARAHRLGGAEGSYVLQADIAACHARAARAGDTDWTRIAALYARLGEIAPSPVIELNRAVAVSMADGPAAALPLVDALAAGGALAGYHPLPAVRGDLLFRLGRHAEAEVAFNEAAALTRNAREQAQLQARAAECGASAS